MLEHSQQGAHGMNMQDTVKQWSSLQEQVEQSITDMRERVEECVDEYNESVDTQHGIDLDQLTHGWPFTHQGWEIVNIHFVNNTRLLVEFEHQAPYEDEVDDMTMPFNLKWWDMTDQQLVSEFVEMFEQVKTKRQIEDIRHLEDLAKQLGYSLEKVQQ